MADKNQILTYVVYEIKFMPCTRNAITSSFSGVVGGHRRALGAIVFRCNLPPLLWHTKQVFSLPSLFFCTLLFRSMCFVPLVAKMLLQRLTQRGRGYAPFDNYLAPCIYLLVIRTGGRRPLPKSATRFHRCCHLLFIPTTRHHSTFPIFSDTAQMFVVALKLRKRKRGRLQVVTSEPLGIRRKKGSTRDALYIEALQLCSTQGITEQNYERRVLSQLS